MGDGIADRLFSVRNLHIGALCFLHADLDILYDGKGFLKPRIIRCNDREIRQPPADLPHLIAAQFRTIAAAAEETYQPVRFIFSECSKKALKGHGIMGVIDHQRELLRHLYHLNSPLHMGLFQRRLNIFYRYFKMAADGDGTERVIDAETPRCRHLRMEIQKALYIKGHPQFPGLLYQRQILCPQGCLLMETVGFQRTGVIL